MFALLEPLLIAAAGYVASHPDLVTRMWQDIAKAIGIHASSPYSEAAAAALQEGIAAAATTAVMEAQKRNRVALDASA